MYYIALLPLTQQFTHASAHVYRLLKQYGWHPRIRIRRYEKKKKKKKSTFWFMWPLVKQSQILKSCQTT